MAKSRRASRVGTIRKDLKLKPTGVRIREDLLQAGRIAAIVSGMSFQDWIGSLIAEKLKDMGMTGGDERPGAAWKPPAWITAALERERAAKKRKGAR